MIFNCIYDPDKSIVKNIHFMNNHELYYIAYQLDLHFQKEKHEQKAVEENSLYDIWTSIDYQKLKRDVEDIIYKQIMLQHESKLILLDYMNVQQLYEWAFENKISINEFIRTTSHKQYPYDKAKDHFFIDLIKSYYRLNLLKNGEINANTMGILQNIEDTTNIKDLDNILLTYGISVNSYIK